MTKDNKDSAPSKDAAMKSQIKSVITGLAVWGVIPAGLAMWLIQREGLKDA